MPTGRVGWTASYEEVLAWRWAGETTASYRALDVTDQAAIIAAFRADQLLSAIEAHEHSKAVKKAQERARRK